MAKTDWGLMDVVKPQDMNNIGQEINGLRSDLDNIHIPPASLNEAGIVKLSNSTDGTREDVAATEKAVGLAFQYGIERKNEVVATLNSIGVPASTSDSWDTLISKMATVVKATGNAKPSDVLAGKTFSNATEAGLVGTLIPGMKMITGDLTSNATGSITSIPFKPYLFMLRGYLESSGVGGYYARAYGAAFAYNSSPIVKDYLEAELVGGSQTGTVRINTIEFGENYVNYSLSRPLYSFRYSIFGV